MDIQLFNDLIKNRLSVFLISCSGQKSSGYHHSANISECYLDTQLRNHGALAFYSLYRLGLQLFAAFQSKLYKQ